MTTLSQSQDHWPSDQGRTSRSRRNSLIAHLPPPHLRQGTAVRIRWILACRAPAGRRRLKSRSKSLLTRASRMAAHRFTRRARRSSRTARSARARCHEDLAKARESSHRLKRCARKMTTRLIAALMAPSRLRSMQASSRRALHTLLPRSRTESRLRTTGRSNTQTTSSLNQSSPAALRRRTSSRRACSSPRSTSPPATLRASKRSRRARTRWCKVQRRQPVKSRLSPSERRTLLPCRVASASQRCREDQLMPVRLTA